MANSKKSCKRCKKFVPADSVVKNNLGTYCSVDCMFNLKDDNSELIAKGKKIRRKLAAKELRELNRNTMSWQEALTQKAFNEMRRNEELLWFAERGLIPTCISCGKPKGGDVWACGHLKTQGSNSRLRFDRLNTYLQHNKRCNSDLSGDIYGTSTTHGYLSGLKLRFGDEEGQRIIDYCESNNAPIKRTCEELEEMRKEFNRVNREVIKKLNM